MCIQSTMQYFINIASRKLNLYVNLYMILIVVCSWLQYGGVRGPLHQDGHHGQRQVPLSGQRAAPQEQVGTLTTALSNRPAIQIHGKVEWYSEIPPPRPNSPHVKSDLNLLDPGFYHQDPKIILGEINKTFY